MNPKKMKQSTLGVKPIGEVFKSINRKLADHDRQFKSIGQKLDEHSEKLDSHTKTLTTLENETMPMIREIYENTKDFRGRVSRVEERVGNLEPRVDVLEAVVARKNS